MPVPPRYWGSVSRYMEVRLFFNSQPDTSAFFAFLKGGAAGIIRPSSSPLRGRRRFAPALSRHCVARLNPLVLGSFQYQPIKNPSPFGLRFVIGGGGGNCT